MSINSLLKQDRYLLSHTVNSYFFFPFSYIDVTTYILGSMDGGDDLPVTSIIMDK